MTMKPRKKIKEGKHFPRSIYEKKHIVAPYDLMTYLAAFRRFKAISSAVVGAAIGVKDMMRKENEESPTTLQEAQIVADTIGATIKIIIQCDGFEMECPLFILQSKKE